MPIINAILDPIRASIYERRGYMRLGNEVMPPDEYNRRVVQARQRLADFEAEQRRRRENGERPSRSIRQRVGEFVNQNIGNDYIEQVDRASDNTFANIATGAAVNSIDTQNQYLKLLLESVLKGGIAAAGGNPLVGVGVGVKNLVSGLPDAIASSLKERGKKQTPAEDEVLYYNENEFPEKLSTAGTRDDLQPQRQQTLVIDKENGIIFDPDTGQGFPFPKESAKSSGEQKRFDNLVMERTDSFIIPGRSSGADKSLFWSKGKVGDAMRGKLRLRRRFLLEGLV